MSHDNAVALLNLAVIAMYEGEGHRSVRSFRSALKLNPDLLEAYIGMGLAYSRMDEYVKMAEAFKQAIRMDPATVRKWTKSSIPGKPEWLSFKPEHAHYTGWIAAFLHNLDEADALVRVAATHISRGWDEAAVRPLEYCLTLAPDYNAAIGLLTIAYLLLESKEEGGSAARLGQNSILKKIIPKVAKTLFRYNEP
jgi:tetratricopeptide (TPR) repeat protein